MSKDDRKPLIDEATQKALERFDDLWFEQEVKPRLRNRAFLVRFADDFVIGIRDTATPNAFWRSCGNGSANAG